MAKARPVRILRPWRSESEGEVKTVSPGFSLIADSCSSEPFPSLANQDITSKIQRVAYIQRGVASHVDQESVGHSFFRNHAEAALPEPSQVFAHSGDHRGGGGGRFRREGAVLSFASRPCGRKDCRNPEKLAF